MTTAVLDRPSVVAEAITIIQRHLDEEARNRRETSLKPKDLCPMQKALLVQDIASILR